ncbi:MAG: four helix bundle protein [Patescibacteria group bacterium]|nr:four helix bundle protein [Patescibacteria group bacterium]
MASKVSNHLFVQKYHPLRIMYNEKCRMYNSKFQGKVFDIRERTFNLGVRIVKLVMSLPRNGAGFAIGNQLIRCGTSIGANTEEAQNSGSKREFIYSITVALKEARETEYWLKIISETGLVPPEKLTLLLKEVVEVIKILTAIVKKSKEGSK